MVYFEQLLNSKEKRGGCCLLTWKMTAYDLVVGANVSRGGGVNTAERCCSLSVGQEPGGWEGAQLRNTYRPQLSALALPSECFYVLYIR